MRPAHRNSAVVHKGAMRRLEIHEVHQAIILVLQIPNRLRAHETSVLYAGASRHSNHDCGFQTRCETRTTKGTRCEMRTIKDTDASSAWIRDAVGHSSLTVASVVLLPRIKWDLHRVHAQASDVSTKIAQGRLFRVTGSYKPVVKLDCGPF